MSKEKLLLVGAGGFGRMVAEQAMLQYDCAFVDDGQPVGTEICGIPVVGSLADLPELRKEYGLLATISSGHRCMKRQKLLALLFPISLLPAPISVRIPRWDAVVWCCKTLASRMVHLSETVFC